MINLHIFQCSKQQKQIVVKFISHSHLLLLHSRNLVIIYITSTFIEPFMYSIGYTSLVYVHMPELDKFRGDMAAG